MREHRESVPRVRVALDASHEHMEAIAEREKVLVDLRDACQASRVLRLCLSEILGDRVYPCALTHLTAARSRTEPLEFIVPGIDPAVDWRSAERCDYPVLSSETSSSICVHCILLSVSFVVVELLALLGLVAEIHHSFDATFSSLCSRRGQQGLPRVLGAL